MSGFKDNVILILRNNGVLQGESVGWVVKSKRGFGKTEQQTTELIEAIRAMKFLVVGNPQKPIVLFDYVVMDSFNQYNTPALLKALDNLKEDGIIIVQVTPGLYQSKYTSRLGSFTITKLELGNEDYLVFHSGVDYGN